MKTNNLVFSGVVGFISEKTTGESKKGNAYQKGYFIVGEPDVKYPNEMKFEWYREGDISTIDNLEIGHEVEVNYSCEASEYQGKHYQKMNMRSLINFTRPIDEPQQVAVSGENKYSSLKVSAPSQKTEPLPLETDVPF